MKDIEDNIYGNQCGSDNAFTRKARLLQSMYRVEIGEEEGFGPTRNSKRKYGNMISGGEVSGKNFLMKETFEYAKERVEKKKKEKTVETIDGFRLFNNLLSSQPMAFNMFYPLMSLLKQDPAKVTLAVRSVFKNLPVFEVTEIGLEFIPTPIENYTNDKSTMDAYIKFVDNKGGKHIIAIETKYTDVLGVNEASRCEEQKQMLVDTGLFSEDFEELLMGGKVKLTQIYRNLLLTERYRMVEGLKDSYSVMLSPKEHPSTQEEISSVTEYLKPEYAYKLSAVSLEDFVDAMIQYLPEYYAQVYERFRGRYLSFGKVDML
ncbi:hypothetical protein H7U35_10285 [Mediterranea massiliensis]|uniref:PD-(D/E)XK nuclease-like domain-containing protein n=1 Tax=Mediterranea massiliensis TaxID=1841865 RepID=A0ABS2E1X2_9BACT|nr:hypothetical protein [Mediterranea massiliensis]MBM6735603.1 hypothetical protein [Mediterranea massiliensis]